MVVPPAFSDLGQAARDLLSKGYNYGSKKKNDFFSSTECNKPLLIVICLSYFHEIRFDDFFSGQDGAENKN